MRPHYFSHKQIVLITALIFLILSFVFFRESEFQGHPNLSGQPTLGSSNAPVEVIAFEDPLCSLCIHYSTDIFPMLRKNYIDTGKVRYSLILVSFIEGSLPNAQALMCMQYQNPSLFFSYMDNFFKVAENSNGPRSQIWKETALEMPGIDVSVLSHCVNNDTYVSNLQKNLEMGQKIMGDEFGTPILIINKTVVPGTSYETIVKTIDKALETTQKK